MAMVSEHDMERVPLSSCDKGGAIARGRRVVDNARRAPSPSRPVLINIGVAKGERVWFLTKTA